MSSFPDAKEEKALQSGRKTLVSRLRSIVGCIFLFWQKMRRPVDEQFLITRERPAFEAGSQAQKFEWIGGECGVDCTSRWKNRNSLLKI